MNQRFSLSATLGATLLASGCATSPISDHLASFTINAAPGHFQAFQAKIHMPDSGVDNSDATVRFLKLQPSDKWAPVAAICVEGSGPDAAKTCLNLVATPGGEVIANRAEKQRGAPDFKREQYGSGYKPGDSFMVRVEARESSVGFSLNGRHLFGSSAVQGPATFEFSCSSAVCSFELE